MSRSDKIASCTTPTPPVVAGNPVLAGPGRRLARNPALPEIEINTDPIMKNTLVTPPQKNLHVACGQIVCRSGDLAGNLKQVRRLTTAAARAGVTITCESQYEPLVMLKHFGPNHPDMPKAVDLGLKE
jgi:hypothetical protein